MTHVTLGRFAVICRVVRQFRLGKWWNIGVLGSTEQIYEPNLVFWQSFFRPLALVGWFGNGRPDFESRKPTFVSLGGLGGGLGAMRCFFGLCWVRKRAQNLLRRSIEIVPHVVVSEKT